VKFGGDEVTQRKAKETVTFHTADGSVVAIDVNDRGEVLGIEIV
jgi:uncharacterized protein YuzE